MLKTNETKTTEIETDDRPKLKLRVKSVMTGTTASTQSPNPNIVSFNSPPPTNNGPPSKSDLFDKIANGLLSEVNKKTGPEDDKKKKLSKKQQKAADLVAKRLAEKRALGALASPMIAEDPATPVSP